MTQKCPYCGFENIAGTDHCDKCRHSFMQKDLPHPGTDKLKKIVMTEKVSDFISKIPPIIVDPETPVSVMIERMQALPSKGCVLICDKNGKLVGIASIRDILLRVAGLLGERERAVTPIKKIMTPNPECLEKDAPLSFALHKMSIGRFRHVPVLDKGIPIGVVSTRDVIEYLTNQKKKTKT